MGEVIAWQNLANANVHVQTTVMSKCQGKCKDKDIVSPMLEASAGSEGSAVVPLEMINEAFKASSPGLLIADVRYKGGMYVELTQTNQHVEYIYVDTIATENYEAFCGMAYDAPARSDPSTELVIKSGACGPVPGQQDNACFSAQAVDVEAMLH